MARTEQRGLHRSGVWAGPLVRVERGEDTPREKKARTEAQAKDSPRRLRGSRSGHTGLGVLGFYMKEQGETGRPAGGASGWGH